jgi:hypothetical protein
MHSPQFDRPNLLRTIYLGHVQNQVTNTLRVSPLVVVPSDKFDEVFVELNASGGVEDGRSGVANEVSRDNGVLGVFDDAFVGACGSLLHRCLNFVIGSTLLEANYEIDHRHVDSGYTEGETT